MLYTQENVLRIVRAGGQLPDDKESLYWLSIKSIPVSEKTDMEKQHRYLTLCPSSVSVGSVANGVGILIQHKNTAVTLGKPLQVGTALNSGVYNIPLEASYYQTQNTITGGQANGTANFTVTYN